MRVLMLDIDTLRPDHLSCYGYHRQTSPNIDAIAAEGVRFEGCHVPDAPCLPSRSALWSGRFGIHTNVVNHGGTTADPFVQGPDRGFTDLYQSTGLIPELRRAGLHTVTISPFGERHSAWWWYAGWNEVYNPGKRGMEVADDVTPLALDWLDRHGQEDNWFLHINYWDPHTPYRTPMEYGNPFENDPLPAWMTGEMRQRSWDGFGPHSAQEPSYDSGLDGSIRAKYPRVPVQIDSLSTMRAWIDGYDTGIWYADLHIGKLVEKLRSLGVYDDLWIIITSDHGENQGELNVWGDHQTADAITCRVPLILRFPGLNLQPRTDDGLIYSCDWAATLLELLGRKVPANWDGASFRREFSQGQTFSRPWLVTSQGAWACQRGVRFVHAGEDYLFLRTYHDGYKELEPLMLFNLSRDSHEQNNIAEANPDLAVLGASLLEEWMARMMAASPNGVDPLVTVQREGGPFHTRGTLAWYVQRLRATGRAQHADRLERLHPNEL